MGVKLNSASSARSQFGGGRPRRINQSKQFTDINVTPFVDVMLVLLIVFMVAAPMMNLGVPVSLPKTSAGKINDTRMEALTVSIDEKGDLYVVNDKVPLDQLKQKLMLIGGMNPNLKIYVRADEKLPYGEIMKVMGYISQSGFTQVSLVVQGVFSGSPKA